MFKIVNGAGRVLELDPETVTTVEKINPFYNDSDELIQDQSFPGLAPLTPNNELFFGFADLVETPNDEYNIPADLYGNASPLSVGNINFSVKANGFDYNLEPNYTARNSLIKGVRLPEIFTNDASFNLFGEDFRNPDPAVFAALMLDTVKFPQKYPFVFAPVKNPSIVTPETPAYDFINPFNDATQSFHTAGAVTKIPFYKLRYVLQVVFEYLGYHVAGSFFTDPEMDKLLIYSRMAISNQVILPSMMYMPNILVTDFLKYCRNRMHLLINMNNATNVATVSTFAQVKRSNEAHDLSKYIITGTEQEIPQNQGFTVILKSDDNDNAFKDENGDTRPLFQLVAGKGENQVELDLGTLKGFDESIGGFIGKRYCIADQSIIGRVTTPANFYPPDLALDDLNDPSTANNWPLRVFKYEGWTALSGSGSYPNSSPYDLNDDDVDHYRSATDSKRLVIPGIFSPEVISSINFTTVYCHKSAGYNYVYYLLEKVAYDFKINDDFVKGRIYARTLDTSIKTKAGIYPMVTEVNNEEWTAFIKAYWDPIATGMETVSAELSTAVYLFNAPTNAKGAGGTSLAFKGSESVSGTQRLIVRRGQPKYLQRLGVKMPFLWSASERYWYVDFTRQIPVVGYRFFYWIVF